MLPGVYKMYDSKGNIIYVGKAKSLKKRVRSYFTKTHEYPKTRLMVSLIADIEIILTRSETEALLLEQSLIKQYQPRFNVTLRDGKSYLYIYLTADTYPRLAAGRGKRQHQAGRFFGPFPSAQSARDTLELLQKLFKVRQCSNAFFAARKRPCLQYQIKRCKAPCVGLVGEAEYVQDVQNSMAFLRGESQALDAQLLGLMNQAAEKLNFENAASYRDQLKTLRQVQAQQAIYAAAGDADVIAAKLRGGVFAVHVLNVRAGRVIGGKNHFPDLDLSLPLPELMAGFVAYFYFQVSDDIPKEIITNVPPDGSQALQAAMKQAFAKAVKIKTQVRQMRAQWLDIALLNVDNALKVKLSDQEQWFARFEALKEVLQKEVDRIECFDVSHTMGEATVASCVVCDSGGLRKRDYRQYVIHDVQAGDDYAAMRQVLMRRYQKNPPPDLLLIDGGKGQLKMAQTAMSEIGVEAFMVGIAKGEGRKAGLETLHFTSGKALKLSADNKALHLLMHIRDEAHRFAISKHRAKRDKKRAGSVLEVIPGLGKKRRRELLNHFGGMQGVLKASQNELELVEGLGPVLARTIYKALHE